MANWQPQLTELGKKMQAERAAMLAKGNPALGGIPQGGTATGQIKFDRDSMMNAYQASMNTQDRGNWFPITGADGKTYMVWPNGGQMAGVEGGGEDRQYSYGPNTGFRIFSDPGITGSWLTDGAEAAKLNGRPYDELDAGGNYMGSSVFKDIKDSKVMGPWGALAVIAMAAGGAAAGLGSGAGGAGAAGVGAGEVGAAGGAMDLGGGIMMGADGAITGATPFATSGLTNAGILESVGAGGLNTAAMGAGGAGGLSAVDLTGTGLPLDSAGSVIGSQAGGGTLSNAAIESIINGGSAASAGAMSTLTSKLGTSGAQNLLKSALGGDGKALSTLTDLLGPVSSIAGGLIGSNAASNAADKQQESVRESNALLERMFNKQIELQEPFRKNGLAAGNRMMELLGIGGNASAPDYGSAAKSFDGVAPQWKDYTNADFVKDPGYEFRMSEGAKALERSAASKGGLFSGAAGKALQRYGQDYASNEFDKGFQRYNTGYGNKVNDFNNSFNRFQIERSAKLNPLQSVYGSGQTSANTLTNAAGTYGQNASQNIQAGGNAAAAGSVGTANAWTNALNGAWGSYQQNELMKRLMPTGG